MITKISFTKMVASGNDFIIVDRRRHNNIHRLGRFAIQVCDRKHGVGADGLLLLERSRRADVKMRIFNPDGSEPQMCGNGVRCAALHTAKSRSEIKIETAAGVIEGVVNKRNGLVEIKMREPRDIKLDLPITIAKRSIKVNFINTGVPHAVIFVEGIDNIDVVGIGRQVRFYKKFLPAGTNVDFMQILDNNNIKLRTYERGVEDETLACGTGAVAAALIYAIRYPLSAKRKINVHTRGEEILKVDFNNINGKFKDIWLEGKARAVYSGVYYV